MKMFETQSLQIDRDLAAISRERLPGITRGLFGNLAQYIDAYRAEVAKEIEGLKGERDRKANPAFELTAQEIQSGLDRVRWAELLIEQLPISHDGRNSWLQSYARRPADLNNGEPLYAESDITSGVMGVDLAAPGERDITVVRWTCCKVIHVFTPPRGVTWTHEAECHECGSKTTIQPR